MKTKLVLIALLLVVVGAVGFGVYRFQRPNVIHGVIICGQVAKGGQPVTNQTAEIFVWLGGQRYLLENEKIIDSGREDRARFKRSISLDAAGKFCLDSSSLKYYYKLSQFKIFAMQLGSLGVQNTGEVADSSGRKPPPMPLSGAVEGFITAGEMDQKTQNLKLEVYFELDAQNNVRTSANSSQDFEILFNNEDRLKPKQ